MFAEFLYVRIQGCGEVPAPPSAGVAELGEVPVAEERGVEGTRRADHLGLDLPSALELRVRYVAEGAHPCEHVVAPLEGAPAALLASPPVGAEARRCLDHPREHRGLAESELLRALSEPALGGGLDSDEVGPERRAVEVLREDLLLREGALHLERHYGLLPLPPEGLGVRLREPHGLHRYGGRAGDAAAVEHVLHGRARCAQRPDAAVRPESAVLGSDERLHDPVVRRGLVPRTAVHVASSERDAEDPSGRVAQNGPAGIRLDRLGVPVDENP